MKSILRTYGRSIAFLSLAVLIAPITASAYYAAPIALTSSPTFITEKSAQLNGQVNPNEMSDTYQWFEWGIVGREGIVYETPHNGMWYAGNTLGNTNATIYGLAPNTQYFYRQVSENGRGKDVGMTTYFTTKKLQNVVTPIIVVETKNADSITETGATIHGYVSPHTGNNSKWWFEWGMTSKLEYRTNAQGTGGNSSPVQVNLTGLTPGTTYFYRMVGENELGDVYGATQVFVTRGVAPAVISEAPRAQNVQSPSQASDNVTRTVTTNGATAASSQGTVGNPWFSVSGPSIFDIFKKKSATPAATTTAAAANSTSDSGKTTSASSGSANTAATQVASAGASTPVGTFWNTLSGKKAVEVNIEKVGPEKVPAHTAIEYRITYAYRLDTPATDARLKIVLPENVVYIGDNTTNELLLEEGTGPERTYVLPVGRMENGTTRTISILGMTTGAANGVFPDARARIEFTKSGSVSVVTAGAAAVGTADVSDIADSMSLLPNSLFGWTLYLALLVAGILAYRKATAYYKQRKEEIAQEEEDARATLLQKGTTA